MTKMKYSRRGVASSLIPVCVVMIMSTCGTPIFLQASRKFSTFRRHLAMLSFGWERKTLYVRKQKEEKCLEAPTFVFLLFFDPHKTVQV